MKHIQSLVGKNEKPIYNSCMSKLDEALQPTPKKPETSANTPATQQNQPNPFMFMSQATPEQVSTTLPFIQPQDAETEVLKSDISIVNFQMMQFLQAWQKPLTVKGVIDLADATQRLLKTRRDLMKMPYGAPVNARKNSAFEILD